MDQRLRGFQLLGRFSFKSTLVRRQVFKQPLRFFAAQISNASGGLLQHPHLGCAVNPFPVVVTLSQDRSQHFHHPVHRGWRNAFALLGGELFHWPSPVARRHNGADDFGSRIIENWVRRLRQVTKKRTRRNPEPTLLSVARPPTAGRERQQHRDQRSLARGQSAAQTAQSCLRPQTTSRRPTKP